MRRFRSSEDAVGTGVVTFLVAGIIFVGSIGTVLVVSHKSNSGVAASDAPAASLNGQAKSLAQFLLESPGYAADGSDWVAGGLNRASATQQAEGLRRLGLRDAGSSEPTMLNFSKFQNLRRAPYYADATDGYVNYEEARRDLGLDATGLDFHIRAYPTLQSVAHLLAHGYRDPNLRVAYIGDIDVKKVSHSNPHEHDDVDPALGLTVSAPTCALSPLTGAYRLSTTITNGGTTDTQFTALFTFNLANTGSKTQTANSLVVPHGGSTTVAVDVPATQVTTGHGGNQVTVTRACAAGSTISADAHDPVSTHATSPTTTLTAANAVTSAAVAARDLYLDAFKNTFVNPTGATSGCSDPVKATWNMPNAAIGDKMALRVEKAGVKVFPASGDYSTWTVPSNGLNGNNAGPVLTGTVTVGCLAAGNYTGKLYYYTGSAPTASSQVSTENFVVVTAAPAAYSPVVPPAVEDTEIVYTPSATASREVAYLNTLVGRFCPTYFDSTTGSPIAGQDWSIPANGVGSDDVWGSATEPGRCKAFKAGLAQPGDVFPDAKDIMNEALNARLLYPDDYADAALRGLPRYDLVNVLVAGSNVDQTAMTSSAAKQAVADWVLGGGTLLVFGSDAQNVNWLEPIFHSAIRSSSGAIGTPDPGHPLLHVPDELDYPHYDNDDRVWNFNGQTAQNAAVLFDNVVVQGADPVTTLSNPGAFGNGRVILTTWMPADVYSGQRDGATAQAEGLKLVNNMLMEGYQGLFLDYGPPLPPSTNVVPSVRYAQISVPDFPEPVQISVVVFVFK